MNKIFNLFEKKVGFSEIFDPQGHAIAFYIAPTSIPDIPRVLLTNEDLPIGLESSACIVYSRLDEPDRAGFEHILQNKSEDYDEWRTLS